MAEKGKLFIGYHSGKKGFNTEGYCFGYDFVNAIAEGYGFVIFKRGRVIRFGYKGQES